MSIGNAAWYTRGPAEPADENIQTCHFPQPSQISDTMSLLVLAGSPNVFSPWLGQTPLWEAFASKPEHFPNIAESKWHNSPNRWLIWPSKSPLGGALIYSDSHCSFAIQHGSPVNGLFPGLRGRVLHPASSHVLR